MKRAMRLGLMGLMMGYAGVSWSADFCDQIGELSKLVMTRRQEGVAMQDLMKIISPADAATPNGKFTKAVIIAAYDRPRFNGEDMRKSSITDFQNEFYLQCVKRM